MGPLGENAFDTPGLKWPAHLKKDENKPKMDQKQGMCSY